MKKEKMKHLRTTGGFSLREKRTHIEVICKVRRLGSENGQFLHNRASNVKLGMKFYKMKQMKQLGPKLVFPPILVINGISSPLSFFLSASTSATHIFHRSYLYNYYNYFRSLCIKCRVSTFHTEI